MKILILGASGTVGKPLFYTLSEKYEVHGTFNRNKPTDVPDAYLHKFDISDIASLDAILSAVKPNLIISSLAGNFEQQLEIHKHLEKYLWEADGRMIFISTANVFDGDVTGQHSEAKAPHPISQYGKFKQACEALLQMGLGDRCLIVRLPKIMDNKTAAQFLKQAETGDPPVYENLYMSFNTAKNVANAIKYCVDTDKCGVLHLTSHDSISISECMELLLAQADKEARLRARFVQNNFLADKKAGYTPQRLTVDSFCALLGCDDLSLLRHNTDNEFRMDLVCTDVNISARFGISCKEIFSSPFATL